MPLYEYKCKHCQKISEVLHGFHESIEKCPECNENQLERLISRPGVFDLKGPGFHKNDYGLTIYRDRE